MHRHAFSLVELVLVLAISAIVGAIAIPRMGNASARYNADFAARKIVLDLEQARNNARLTGTNQTITFDLSQHRYTVTGSISGSSIGYVVNLNTAPYNAKLLTASFAGSNVATFTAFGECLASGTITIRAGNTTRTVTLDDASGKARWQ